MQDEEYRQIKDFENYEVSNLGNIRNNKTNKILKPRINTHGYYSVILYDNGKAKNFGIHRLVAESFISNPENKKCVDHRDNNRLNNNIINLRWCNYEENNRNLSMSKNNTSNYKGVSLCKKSNKYRAMIYHNGKNFYLGAFNSKEEAALARLERAKEIYGEFMNACEHKITENINIQHSDNQ